MSEAKQLTQARVKRRNFLINPRYQLKYVLWLAANGLILTILNWLVFYTYISENYQILVELSPMTDQARAALYLELRQIFLYLGAASVGFMALVAVLGVFVTHRTAGPLHHFKRVFREIKQGDLDLRIHLRPHDDFQDVAKAFNEMMDSITRRT